MIIEIKNAQEFTQYVSTGDCLVDFNATWCGPCKMLSPILDQLDREGSFPDLKILKVDVDRVPEIAARFGIQLIPTLMLFDNGTRIKVTQGYQTLDALKKFVTK